MNLIKLRDILIITKLRFSCHILNIEIMRYYRPKNIRHKRFCPSRPDTIECEGHFLLNLKKNNITCTKTIDLNISEIVHEFGKRIDAIKHILNQQTKQNCKSICNFIGDALHVRKCSINK